MSNEDVICRKLVKINEYLGELEPITRFSLEEYQKTISPNGWLNV